MTTLRSLKSLAVFGCVISLAGCDDDSDDGTVDTQQSVCEQEDRADAFALGLEKSGAMLTMTLADASPAVPIRGDNDWTLMITDSAGAGIDDLDLSVVTYMPDHEHGSPVQAEVESMGNGEYNIVPVNLFMAGYWTVTMVATSADGMSDEAVFNVCVE